VSLTRSNVGEKEMKAEFFLPDDYRPAEDELKSFKTLVTLH